MCSWKFATACVCVCLTRITIDVKCFNIRLLCMFHWDISLIRICLLLRFSELWFNWGEQPNGQSNAARMFCYILHLGSLWRNLEAYKLCFVISVKICNTHLLMTFISHGNKADKMQFLKTYLFTLHMREMTWICWLWILWRLS